MESWRRNQKNREIMTDIVIRALSKKEAHELRMLKLQLEERNWRTLFLRIVRERQRSRTGITKVKEEE
uniref:Uncharacterized protein n=2 Tax=viral metagenome TaxID=1070528 RepID=A0A6M3Y5P0_9ZZZZ